MLYVTGDIHGDPFERFSYNRNVDVREINEDDYVIIAGDFGCVWDWRGNSNEDAYKLSWLNSKPWTTIVVLGNHEAWNVYEDMPDVTPDFVYAGSVKQCVYMNKVYDKIYIVDSVAILKLCDKAVLAIAGADSHDKMYRTEGKTWWPQEKINIAKCIDFFEKNSAISNYYDLIVTHDAPSIMMDGIGSYYYLRVTYGEMFLDMVRQNFCFGKWIHGHMHLNFQYPEDVDSRVRCVYEDIVSI